MVKSHFIRPTIACAPISYCRLRLVFNPFMIAVMNPQGPERRRFERLPASFLCTVHWQDCEISGQISNISLGGAFVTQVNTIPPEGAPVVLAFQFRDNQLSLKGEINSKVVHSLKKFLEDSEIGYLGVQFMEPPEKLESLLNSVIETLSTDRD